MYITLPPSPHYAEDERRHILFCVFINFKFQHNRGDSDETHMTVVGVVVVVELFSFASEKKKTAVESVFLIISI